VLAFNLAVFFRNLAGAEVEFTAKNPRCAFQFIGSVEEFRQEQDVGTRLSVTLRGSELVCRISIEEEEAPDAPEEAKVEVRLALALEKGEREVFHTAFRFEEISLKPHAPDPAAGPLGGEEPPLRPG
jgi:hypothetical protein